MIRIRKTNVLSMNNCSLDLGFYALPAKEELSPMFPHNSSSHEISTETNAFVQNSMVGSPLSWNNKDFSAMRLLCYSLMFFYILGGCSSIRGKQSVWGGEMGRIRAR